MPRDHLKKNKIMIKCKWARTIEWESFFTWNIFEWISSMDLWMHPPADRQFIELNSLMFKASIEPRRNQLKWLKVWRIYLKMHLAMFWTLSQSFPFIFVWFVTLKYIWKILYTNIHYSNMQTTIILRISLKEPKQKNKQKHV